MARVEHKKATAGSEMWVQTLAIDRMHKELKLVSNHKLSKRLVKLFATVTR